MTKKLQNLKKTHLTIIGSSLNKADWIPFSHPNSGHFKQGSERMKKTQFYSPSPTMPLRCFQHFQSHLPVDLNLNKFLLSFFQKPKIKPMDLWSNLHTFSTYFFAHYNIMYFHVHDRKLPIQDLRFVWILYTNFHYYPFNSI